MYTLFFILTQLYALQLTGLIRCFYVIVFFKAAKIHIFIHVTHIIKGYLRFDLAMTVYPTAVDPAVCPSV